MYNDKMLEETLEAFDMYVYRHMSLREISRELLITPPTVASRLESLEFWDDDKYQLYKHEKKRHKAGRKPRK